MDEKPALEAVFQQFLELQLEQKKEQAKRDSDQKKRDEDQAKRDEHQYKLIQQLLASQSQAVQPVVQANSGNKEQLVAALSARIEMFNFVPDEGQTFDRWYSRYGAILCEDGRALDDTSKVRLLLSKMCGSDFRRFSDAIQPAEPYSKTFDETISLLKGMFAATSSLVVRRYECFKLLQKGGQDEKDYAAEVNAAWENAEVSKIKSDELKCLSFVAGLQADKHEKRLRCIRLLESAEADPSKNIKLSDLIEECKKQDQFKDTVDRLTPRAGNYFNTHSSKFQGQKGKWKKKPAAAKESQQNAEKSTKQLVGAVDLRITEATNVLCVEQPVPSATE